MLEFHNSKERDVDDWIELLKTADPNFHLLDIKRPSGSRLAFIEVAWGGSMAEADVPHPQRYCLKKEPGTFSGL